MSAQEFCFPARDLDASGKHFCVVVRAAWIRHALEGTDVRPGGMDGELDLRLSKSGRDVVVQGRLSATLDVGCARCLQPAHVAITERLSALVVPTGAPAGATQEENDDETASHQADVISYDGETVVLDDLVRDELLLGVPMIPLCSESCPGIRPETSPESASASGIDPRFRPLLRLRKSPT